MPLKIVDQKTGKPVVTLEDDGELKVENQNSEPEEEEDNDADQTAERD